MSKAWTVISQNVSIRGIYLERMEIRVLNFKLKSCVIATETYMRANWWNWNFLNGNLPEKSHEADAPNSKPFWRYSVILVRGHNVPPGLNSIKTESEVASAVWRRKRKMATFAWIKVAAAGGNYLGMVQRRAQSSSSSANGVSLLLRLNMLGTTLRGSLHRSHESAV